MDASELAKQIGPYLMPLIPYLVKGIKIAGKEFVAGAGGNLGEKAVEKIQEIWDELWAKINQDSAQVQKTEQIAANLDDSHSMDNLVDQLHTLFGDELLRNRIELLYVEAKSSGATIQSVQELGKVLGRAINIKIASGKDVQESGITSFFSQQKADSVEKDAEVIGIQIGDNSKKRKSSSYKKAVD